MKGKRKNFMDNFIKFNSSSGGGVLVNSNANPIVGGGTMYTLPNVDCYVLFNVYQLTNSYSNSLVVDGNTITKESGTESSGSWHNTCFITQIAKDSTIKLTYKNSDSDPGASSASCLFLTKKPTLIDSKAVVNTYKTFTATPNKDLICVVNGYDNKFTVSGAKYTTVCKLYNGNTIFYVPKSSETITITYGSNGVMNLFEL